jgi:hypothetical protein
MPQPVQNARALKCTVVLDSAEMEQIVSPDGRQRIVIDIRLPDGESAKLAVVVGARFGSWTVLGEAPKRATAANSSFAATVEMRARSSADTCCQVTLEAAAATGMSSVARTG